MRFGVYLTTAQPPGHSPEAVFDNAVRYAQKAEDLGFDGAWVFEHHFSRFGLSNAPLTLAAYLLGHTTRLRVGTSITVVPLYHPIRLAEQVALIDQVSHGRLDFGVGRGTCKPDFDFFGVDMGETHTILSEYMDIIERAWRDDVVESDGAYVKFPAVPVYPRPWTKPRPTVYAAAESPRTTEWAASRGYPMLLNHWIEEEAMLSQLELYEETSLASGHDPAAMEHIFSCIAYLDESREAARREVRDNLAWWRRVGIAGAYKFEELRRLPNYEFHFRRWEDEVLKSGGNRDEAFEKSLDHMIEINPIGTVEQCVERLGRVIERTGIRHVVCGFEGSGDPDKTIGNMARFAAEVMPELRRIGATARSGAGGGTQLSVTPT
jgi:alkanal monooxygenase alpha chain